jgi:hypothetical protein
MLGKMRLLFAMAAVSATFLACNETQPERQPDPPRAAMEEQPQAPADSAVQPEAVLGGPCLANSPEDADFRNVAELRNKAIRAERAQDWADAVLLAKDVVRGDCSNEYWWFKLAEFQMKTDSPADAVATLSAFDTLDGNAVDRRLRDAASPLHALLEDEAYRSSDLAQNIAEDRRLRDMRRAAALNKLAAIKRPPENYVAKGACPFECCTYREWTAAEATKLYREPGSDEVAGTVQPGKVDALGGELRLHPKPVLVRYPRSDGQEVAEPGTIVFLVDYSGEGHGNVWIDGKVKDAGWSGVQELCATPNESCWGEVLRPGDAGNWLNGVWWIQIKTKDGTTGWTSQADNFSGKDRCS